MNPAYWHLALNHLPVVGVLFGLVIFLVGWLRQSHGLLRVALWTWFIVALLCVPAYLTGLAAENIVMPWPGVLDEPIEDHREAATLAFIGMIVLGVASLVALIANRRAYTMPTWITPVFAAAGLAVTVAMARTAHLGGQIRHPELDQPEPPAESAPAPSSTQHHH